MAEDGLFEEDIWDYKSIRKSQSKCQNSEVISANVQKTNHGKGRLHRRKSNRRTSEDKHKTNKTKQVPEQMGSQTSLKLAKDCSFPHGDPATLSQESVSPTSANRKKRCKKQVTSKARPSYEGYCPSCQMPLSLLLIETPHWHVTECLDSSGTAEKECPEGLLCASTIPSHYKRYSHFLLAACRAKDHLAGFSSSSLENSLFRLDVACSIGCDTPHRTLQDVNNPNNMSKPPEQCIPLTQHRSSYSVNIAKIQFSPSKSSQEFQPPRIQSIDDTNQIEHLNLPSQEVEGHEDLDSQNQFKRLISEVDCDFDISYSPLHADEEEITETEGEEEDRSLEDKNRKIRSCMFNRTKQKEFEHTGVKIQNYIAGNEFCETLNTPQHINGITNSHPNSLSIAPNQVQQPLKEVSIPVDYRKSNNKLEWYKPSTAFNAGECGWGNSNEDNWVSAEADNKDVWLPSEFKKESVGSFPVDHSDTIDKINSILESKGKAVTGPYGNRFVNNNSFPIPEKEGSLYNTIAMPVFPSASIKAQTSPAKELKQMDIGVFFGLQPKGKMESDQKKNLCKESQALSPSTTKRNLARTRKRKAEESLGDSDMVAQSSVPNTPLDTGSVDSVSGGQRKWQKKFRGSWATQEETTRKRCPFYKKIPGTSFVVDAFQYGEIEGCTAYFLTHFHSDHYGGLTKKFTFPIYCNKITGNLIKNKLRVQEQYVHILPMDTECIINGVKVVLLDANHCPGAAMILFSLPNGTVVLHTGDFRADPSMERCSSLIGCKVHTLYLDTTYCNPEYTFPSQQEVLQFAVNIAFETVTLRPRTLVVCGTYSIGKEKVFLAIAQVLGSKVSVSQEKYKTLQCLESETINSLITMEWNNTLLHLLPMMQINFKGLQNHLNRFSGTFDHILAFKPTGWTYSDRCCSLSEIQPQTRGKITVYGIPYSEHSSFLEIRRFVQWLKPHKIIPTVHVGDWKARNEMEKHFRDWKSEVAERN